MASSAFGSTHYGEKTECKTKRRRSFTWNNWRRQGPNHRSHMRTSLTWMTGPRAARKMLLLFRQLLFDDGVESKCTPWFDNRLVYLSIGDVIHQCTVTNSTKTNWAYSDRNSRTDMKNVLTHSSSCIWGLSPHSSCSNNIQWHFSSLDLCSKSEEGGLKGYSQRRNMVIIRLQVIQQYRRGLSAMMSSQHVTSDVTFGLCHTSFVSQWADELMRYKHQEDKDKGHQCISRGTEEFCRRTWTRACPLFKICLILKQQKKICNKTREISECEKNWAKPLLNFFHSVQPDDLTGSKHPHTLFAADIKLQYVSASYLSSRK